MRAPVGIVEPSARPSSKVLHSCTYFDLICVMEVL